MRSEPTLERLASGGSGLLRLREVSAALGRAEAPAQLLTLLLGHAAELAGGTLAALLVSPEQLAAITGHALSEGRVQLSTKAVLVAAGELASEIRDWEGAPEPVSTADGRHLILPLHSGGMAVVEPESGAMLDEARTSVLAILADLAAGAVSAATRMEEARQRAAALEETRQRLREQNTLLRELAVVDELTGLYNRRFLERRLAYELERFKRYHHPLSLALLDVDHFKRVNDTHGHGAGDIVLRNLSRIALATLRRTDIVARYGGEEFAMLMPDTPIDGAAIAARRLCARISEETVEVGGVRIGVTASIGVAAAEGEFGGDAEHLIRSADRALYQAKAEGRNRVIVAGAGGER